MFIVMFKFLRKEYFHPFKTKTDAQKPKASVFHIRENLTPTGVLYL